ncbi:hypothetical protein EB155_07890 [archaeon]|nr:hypothetical protein [archaeon]
MIKPDVFQTNRNPRAWEQYGGYLPIFEKENAFTYLRNYDQVAIIDADVFVRENASNIFDSVSEQYNFGAVVERDMPITNDHASRINNYSRNQYGTIKNIDWDWNNKSGGKYFNMGVMVLNKSIEKYLRGETPKQFLSRPEFKPFVDGLGQWKWSTDQTLLNVWIRSEKMSIKELDWKFNTLFGAVRHDKIKDGHFIHFFLKSRLPNNGEDVDQLMEMI